ncbi:hypothetical protein [Streptomyces sp. NPDC015350]|uniref:hypothetical protein n=1 Tax=Streptomyces sp. NPDC015350 TaxID=3364955 RepID=UPI003700B0A3
MSSRWNRAIAELSAQGDAARAAAQRVRDVPSEQRTTAVAISYVAETDYLRSASTLLRAHLVDRNPPRRLPVARVWPCLRDAWKAQALARCGGVWRVVPRNAALARMRSAPSALLLAAVIEQAEALQASLCGERQVDRLYESYIPDRTSSPAADLLGSGRTAPTLPGFPDPGHPLNRAFPRGGATGVRIQHGREAEFNKLSSDRSAVYTRALTFGDAVLALLVEHRVEDVLPESGRLRGVGRWVGREQQLVPDRAKWPTKLDGYQGAALAEFGWLVLACTGIPLTFGQRADLLSHYTLLLLAAGLIACAGTALIYRHAPKLITAGPRALFPGIVAAAVAFTVWQGQGPVADYYFAGPYDRYDREYANECLAASPYRHDAVRAIVNDGVLTVTPVEGGTTLHLGPAEDGSMHPLHPLDRATRAVLDTYGC